jgi:hypothetical protein
MAPAQLQLSEPVIDAALLKLRTGMASRLQAINTQFADNMPLWIPSDSDFYFAGVADSAPIPLVVVTDGGTGDQGRFAEEGPHSLAIQLQLVVLVCDQDADRQRLARKLLRLERAVTEVLYDDEPKEQLVVTVDGVTNYPYIRPARLVPGPVFNPEDDSSMFRQWRIVVFDVLKYEN